MFTELKTLEKDMKSEAQRDYQPTSVPGRAFDPRSVLSNAVANVICVLVFGDRFEYSDSGFQSLLKDINEAVYLQGGVCAQVLHLNIFTYKAL